MANKNHLQFLTPLEDIKSNFFFSTRRRNKKSSSRASLTFVRRSRRKYIHSTYCMDISTRADHVRSSPEKIYIRHSVWVPKTRHNRLVLELLFLPLYKKTKISVLSPWRDKKLCQRTSTKKSATSIERDFCDPKIYPNRLVL